MSQLGIIYRLDFKNIKNQEVRIDISPTDILIPDIYTPEVFYLVGTANPLVVSTINNERDKFQSVRSKQAIIQFRSDSAAGFDINTFSKGSDSLWKVDISLISTSVKIFTGFLILDDNQQPFQPDPQVVTLTATDHLGALKDVPLVTSSDVNPTGKIKIGVLIADCLRKTGLSLNINVVNNLRTGSGEYTAQALFSFAGQYIAVTTVTEIAFFYPGQEITITGTASNNGTRHVVRTVFLAGVTEVYLEEAIVSEGGISTTFTDTVSDDHFYHIVYLDAKTFESIIGECEDCYSALEKILGQDCYITQWKGEWWIMRVDEFDSHLIYRAIFNSSGVYVSTSAGTTYNKSIGNYTGAAEDIKFADADTLLQFIRPHGLVKETYNYKTPLEVPCNIDWERGTLTSTPSSTEKRYSIECWTLQKGSPLTPPGTPTISAYLTKIFNNLEYEIERYVVLTPTSATANADSLQEYIISEAIPVIVGDKFVTSVDWRLASNIATGGGNYKILRAFLNGDDGSWWILGNIEFVPSTYNQTDYKWWDTAGWTLNTGAGDQPIDFDDIVETDWKNLSWDAPPVPVTGKIYLVLHQFNQVNGTDDNLNINFSNLNFEYVPLINGSYRKYLGEEEKIVRTATGYLAKQDNEVFIKDSPKPLFKGAMFVILNSKYKLTRNWYAAGTIGLVLQTDPSFLHSYGHIQIYSVWNQFRGTDDPSGRGRGINVFSGTVYGLDEVTNDWPDLLHKYSLTDLNTSTNNRYFMLISFSQDWKTCLWSAVFVEVYNTVSGKVYTDVRTFKYLE